MIGHFCRSRGYLRCTGIQTLNIILDEKLAEGTPVVALTADAIVGAKDSYIKEGFTDYLSKPVMFPELEDIPAIYLDSSLILSKEHCEDAEGKSHYLSSIHV